MTEDKGEIIQPLYLWFFFAFNLGITAGSFHILKMSMNIPTNCGNRENRPPLCELGTAIDGTVRFLVILFGIVTFIYTVYSGIKFRHEIRSHFTDDDPIEEIQSAQEVVTDWELLGFILQENRAEILQDIIGHPQKSPSLEELQAMNPDTQVATLQEHIQRLIDENIVKAASYNEEREDVPSKYFTLTEFGRDFLTQHGQFIDEKEKLEEEYISVNKPEEILEIQDAPRPSGIVDEIES